MEIPKLVKYGLLYSKINEISLKSIASIFIREIHFLKFAFLVFLVNVPWPSAFSLICYCIFKQLIFRKQKKNYYKKNSFFAVNQTIFNHKIYIVKCILQFQSNLKKKPFIFVYLMK